MVEEIVKTKEYKIKVIKDGDILYTQDLNGDIAFTCFSPKLKKIAMARSIDKVQIGKLFAELNPGRLSDEGLIDIYIIGGDNSNQSKEYTINLLDQLKEIDKGANIMNIKGYDTNERNHPNSFKIDCYHGGINDYSIEHWKQGNLSFADREKQKTENSKNQGSCNIS